MALEDILRKIDEETAKQEEEILNNAKMQAEEILRQAEIKAKEITEEYRKKAKEDGESLRKQLISAAILENRNAVEMEINKIQDKIMELLYQKLKEFVSSSEYSTFLREKIQNGWETLGPGSLIIANPQDVKVIKSLSFPLNIIEKNIDPIGGIIITSADGKIEIDYTFTEIIRDKSDELRRRIRTYITG